MATLTPTFTWTAEEGRRMRRAWLMYTRNGKRQRKSMWFLFACATGGLGFGVLALARPGLMFGGASLSAVSGVLMFMLYCWRTKTPHLAQDGTRIQWAVSPDGLRVNIGATIENLPWQTVRQVLRTPEGFWIWPNDAFERWLPRTAFSSPQEQQELASLLQSKVKRYAEVS